MKGEPPTLAEVMTALRSACHSRGIGGEALRDLFNKGLKPDQRISTSTSFKWLAGSNANSKNILLIQRIIKDIQSNIKIKSS